VANGILPLLLFVWKTAACMLNFRLLMTHSGNICEGAAAGGLDSSIHAKLHLIQFIIPIKGWWPDAFYIPHCVCGVTKGFIRLQRNTAICSALSKFVLSPCKIFLISPEFFVLCQHNIIPTLISP
jgi:hypothetical protein